nr:MAG TPA: major capsid protein [Bacteriophage sp.]
MNFKKLKELREKKEQKVKEAEKCLEKATNETRALTEEENKEYEALIEEVRALSDTISKLEEAYDNEINKGSNKKNKEDKDEKFEEEKRAFLSYVKGQKTAEEMRSDENWTVGDNGAVIPTSIANKILEEVKDRCNIWNYSSKFNVGGTLTFPQYDESTQRITMAYADEFGTLTATSGKFKSVSMTGFLASALTKISRSLMNNSQFDLFSYVVSKMAEAIADWLEKELLKGTDAKIEGLSKAEVVATTLTSDSLIDLQDSIKSIYQHNAKWIMNSKTKNAIRKMKDGQDNYLLVTDYVGGVASGYTLLGKPVELSDQMADGDIFYGDFSGLYVKIAETPSVQVLNEKFAEEHAVGLVAWLEIDAKLIEPEKVKRLTATGLETAASKKTTKANA